MPVTWQPKPWDTMTMAREFMHLHGVADRSSYDYGNGGALVNRRNIHDPGELLRFEDSISRARAEELRHSPVHATYDMAHVKRIHEKLFGDVYSWAGQFNQAEQHLQSRERDPRSPDRLSYRESVERMFMDMRTDMLKSRDDKERFVTSMVSTLHSFETWKPFARGNRQVAAVYMEQLSAAAGYEFDMSRHDIGKWRDAVDAAFKQSAYRGQGDETMLRTIIRTSARPFRAAAFSVAMRTGDRTDATQRHPELQIAFAAIGCIPSSNTVDRIQKALDSGMDPASQGGKWLRQLIRGRGRGVRR